MSKKLYFTRHYYNPNFSLQKTIENDFNNFSLNGFLQIQSLDDFSKTLKEAKENTLLLQGDKLSSLIIVEYSLSTNDLLDLLINQKLYSIPTNSWYWWWNENKKTLIKINKKIC